MKSNLRRAATLAMSGVWLCLCLAPGQARAQSTQTAQVQTGAAETPATRLLRQSIARETRHLTLGPAGQQKRPPEQRSWVSRHKVLTAVLIGVTPFAIWGGLMWHTCSGGGC
jgi:hypothetical protein